MVTALFLRAKMCTSSGDCFVPTSKDVYIVVVTALFLRAEMCTRSGDCFVPTRKDVY